MQIVAFSSQPSVADLLQRMLSDAGFRSSAVWSTAEDLEVEVRRTCADAIVYEVGVPFAEHWRQLQETRTGAALRGVPIVIATSAPREQYHRVGVSFALKSFRRSGDSAEVRATMEAAIAAAAAPLHKCV